MKQFLLGAAVATALTAAAGFAVMKEPVAAKRVVPVKLSDLTLDRSFRFTIAIPNTPAVVPGDPNVGYVIDYVSTPDSGSLGAAVSIGPIGAIPEAVFAGPLVINQGLADPARTLAHPIVIRPGEGFAIHQTYTSFSYVTIAGYFVYPGEV